MACVILKTPINQFYLSLIFHIIIGMTLYNCSDPQIYHIYGTYTAWLYPALELLGLGLQVYAACTRRLLILIIAVTLTSVFAALEKDLSLLVADILAASGLLWLLHKPDK